MIFMSILHGFGLEGEIEWEAHQILKDFRIYPRSRNSGSSSLHSFRLTSWIHLIFSSIYYNLTFIHTEIVVKIISDLLIANPTVNIQTPNEMTHFQL